MSNITLKLVTPMVPNYISVEMPTRPRQEGFTELPKFDVAELTDAQLNAIADDWRARLLANAARRRSST